ncbi:hypothetical protein T265_10227 [Opisthorchis viverrini]|uniref:Uncharacterized protein n=1 Tax=Opisthorchis viverrini TaxID=6198 RepID=A0A074Z322_OPIVI|nr:hypothetical protein T265_10227 [Opisthorchis viverrini]KER21466.1 hypothetical protein T265_10227 [Opisthorchis viverrini]
MCLQTLSGSKNNGGVWSTWKHLSGSSPQNASQTELVKSNREFTDTVNQYTTFSTFEEHSHTANTMCDAMSKQFIERKAGKADGPDLPSSILLKLR